MRKEINEANTFLNGLVNEEYLTYETGELNNQQAYQMIKFLDSEIGTFHETSWQDRGVQTISVFELTRSEVEAIREFEKSLTEADLNEKNPIDWDTMSTLERITLLRSKGGYDEYDNIKGIAILPSNKLPGKIKALIGIGKVDETDEEELVSEQNEVISIISVADIGGMEPDLTAYISDEVAEKAYIDIVNEIYGTNATNFDEADTINSEQWGETGKEIRFLGATLQR